MGGANCVVLQELCMAGLWTRDGISRTIWDATLSGSVCSLNPLWGEGEESRKRGRRYLCHVARALERRGGLKQTGWEHGVSASIFKQSSDVKRRWRSSET